MDPECGRLLCRGSATGGLQGQDRLEEEEQGERLGRWEFSSGTECGSKRYAHLDQRVVAKERKRCERHRRQHQHPDEGCERDTEGLQRGCGQTCSTSQLAATHLHCQSAHAVQCASLVRLACVGDVAVVAVLAVVLCVLRVGSAWEQRLVVQSA